MYGLYRDWLHQNKFVDFLGLSKLERYRGPIGKDESDGEMVVWFQ